MKTRYKILIANLVSVVLLVIFGSLKASSAEEKADNGLEKLISLYDSASTLLTVFFIITGLVIMISLLGLFKKNKEYLWGGVYSFILNTIFLGTVIHFSN